MIEEAYCSYEVCKLLKDNGFDTPCDWAYNNKEGLFEVRDNPNENIYCYKPTQQMAMRWLREVHGLHVDIAIDDLDWSFQIFDINNRDENLDPVCVSESYACHKTYEEAVEAAIKWVLENLI